MHLPGALFDRLQEWAGDHLPHAGVLSTACENCETTGEVEETRPRRLTELSPMQMGLLLEGDLYRENGDPDEHDMPDDPSSHGGMPSGGGGGKHVPSGGGHKHAGMPSKLP